MANGHAGVACYSWSPTSVSYRMTVNLHNEVQVAWKNLNSSVQATGLHPVNEWVNLTWTIPKVAPNTSLGYTNYFYAQQADGLLTGHNIKWNAENTTIDDTFLLPRKPILGTHFSVTTAPTQSGGDNLMIFIQELGMDITVNSRDLQSGQWTYSTLPIPDG